MVRLKTNFAGEGRLDLALVAAGAVGPRSETSGGDNRPDDVPWEEDTAELSFDEELGVENVRRRVEGRARDGGIDVVGGGDSVADHIGYQ